MDLQATVLAFTAGLVAAVNPCGFALLPGYLSLTVLADTTPGRSRAMGRALSTSGLMTLGFAVVFLGFGLIVAPVASSAQQYLPWVTLVLGLGLAASGVWLAAGRRIPALRVGARRPGSGNGPLPAFGYGVFYALASLTCTVGPFLAVVVSSFRSGSTGAGLVLFAAYALGMGALVATAAIAVALARTSLLGRLRRSGAWLPRVVGVVLLLVGAYVAWYGAWELRVLSGATAGPDPIVSAAAGVQSDLVGLVRAGGLWWLALPAVLVLAGALHRRPRATRRVG